MRLNGNNSWRVNSKILSLPEDLKFTLAHTKSETKQIRSGDSKSLLFEENQFCVEARTYNTLAHRKFGMDKIFSHGGKSQLLEKGS